MFKWTSKEAYCVMAQMGWHREMGNTAYRQYIRTGYHKHMNNYKYHWAKAEEYAMMIGGQ